MEEGDNDGMMMIVKSQKSISEITKMATEGSEETNRDQQLGRHDQFSQMKNGAALEEEKKQSPRLSTYKTTSSVSVTSCAKFKCQACDQSFLFSNDHKKHRKTALHKQNQKLWLVQQQRDMQFKRLAEVAMKYNDSDYDEFYDTRTAKNDRDDIKKYVFQSSDNEVRAERKRKYDLVKLLWKDSDEWLENMTEEEKKAASDWEK